MYKETKESLYFMFIDFGSAFDMTKINQSKVKTFSPPFSPPEQNTDLECERSDIFSLSVTLSHFLVLTQIQVNQEINQLLEEMKDPKVSNRPSTSECISRISRFGKFSSEKIDLKNSIKKIRSGPTLLRNFELLRQKTTHLRNYIHDNKIPLSKNSPQMGNDKNEEEEEIVSKKTDDNCEDFEQKFLEQQKSLDHLKLQLEQKDLELLKYKNLLIEKDEILKKKEEEFEVKLKQLQIEVEKIQNKIKLKK